MLAGMKPREIEFDGKPVPKIDKDEHKDKHKDKCETEHKKFLLNFQNAIILSLAERGLLTESQAEQAMDALISLSSREK